MGEHPESKCAGSVGWESGINRVRDNGCCINCLAAYASRHMFVSVAESKYSPFRVMLNVGFERLTVADQNVLVAFLMTLTDDVLNVDPKFQNPFKERGLTGGGALASLLRHATPLVRKSIHCQLHHVPD